MVSVLVALTGAVAAGGQGEREKNREAELALKKDDIKVVIKAIIREPPWEGVHWDRRDGKAELINCNNHGKCLVLFINFALEAV
jgi:hypothetical protein